MSYRLGSGSSSKSAKRLAVLSITEGVLQGMAAKSSGSRRRVNHPIAAMWPGQRVVAARAQRGGRRQEGEAGTRSTPAGGKAPARGIPRSTRAPRSWGPADEQPQPRPRKSAPRTSAGRARVRGPSWPLAQFTMAAAPQSCCPRGPGPVEASFHRSPHQGASEETYLKRGTHAESLAR